MLAAEFYFPDPKSRVVQADLTVVGGSSKSLALPVLGRGTITKLIVAQLTGALEGFTYSLHNSKLAYPPGDAPTAGAMEPLFRVIGPIAVATAKNVFDGGAGWDNDGVPNAYVPFHNVDGDPSNIPNLLYLRIAPAGSGSKTFGVALTVVHPSN